MKQSRFQWKLPRRATVARLAVALILSAIVVVLMLWFSDYWTPKISAGPVAQSAPVRRYHGPLLTARIMHVPVKFFAVGTIEPIAPVVLAPRIMGKIIFSRLHAGLVVQKNQILVRLDHRTLTADLHRIKAAAAVAMAGLKQAELDRRRTAELFKTADITRAAMDLADTRLAAARAEYVSAMAAQQAAATQLRYAAIRSPVNGVVMEKRVNTGDTVMPGQDLARIYKPAHMQLTAVVPESYVRRLRPGQSLTMRLAGFHRRFAVHVRRIIPKVSVQTRSFTVKAAGTFPSGVFPGMFGRLEIPIGQEKVLVIPASAIKKIGQLDMVNIVTGGPGGRMRRQLIRPGRKFGDLREILSGLKAGDKLATGGSYHD